MSFNNPKKHNPMAAIEARQRQEEVVRDYARVTAENSRQKLIADWEIKSGHTVSKKELYRHMDSVQAQHDDVLIARRQRLTELLQQEKAEYDAMLANLNETDEQRRERLTQKARELRTQREALRKEEANVKLDQLFRESNDVLRQAESRVKTMQTADQRREQLAELQRRRDAEAEVERYYQEQKDQVEREQRARAQRDLEAIHIRGQKMQADLTIQCAANDQRKEAERQRLREDDEVFFAQLREEQARNAEKDAARRQKQLNLAAEMKIRNDELHRIKHEEYEKLRKEDRDALDELLRGIAEDEARETKRKTEQREAAKLHMKLVEAQMSEQAANESALDQMWQDENDKEWEKREKKWLSEQDKRETLLRNVVATRKSQIRETRSREDTVRSARQAEHEQLIATMRNMADVDAKMNQDRRTAARSTQEFLQTQMSAKFEGTQRELDAKRNDASGARAEEEAYRAKLQAELGRLDAAKPESMRHVRLQPKRNNIW
jgi:cilia- and flagella-associated protein 53